MRRRELLLLPAFAIGAPSVAATLPSARSLPHELAVALQHGRPLPAPAIVPPGAGRQA